MDRTVLCWLFPLLISLSASSASAARIEQTVQTVGGVRVEILRDLDRPIKGKYLLSLNYAPSSIERKPPYNAILFTLDGNGRVDVLRRISSSDQLMWAIDLKLQPDGYYTYAVNRPKQGVWQYELRILDPKTGTEIIEPKGYPVRDPALDGHETIVYSGDRRLFLFYRQRQEDGKSYLDAEVLAVSAKTGEAVGKWSSGKQFPAEMTGDYLHVNSLFPMSDDRVLASARATSTLYIINLTSGKIDDQIDAKSWKFVDDPMNGFARQHFAHFRDNGNLVLYDNRDQSEPNANSRAVEYAVDWKARTLTLVWEHRASPSMAFRYGWGSAAMLGNDEALIGWGDYPRAKDYCEGRTGSFPVFSHISRNKDPLFELRAPCGWATYRVYFVPDAANR